MAVTTFDAQQSFAQESLARLGDRGVTGKLSEEQQKKLSESKAMQAQRKADELCQQLTWNRDSQRASTDTFFVPKESDFTAPKTYQFQRSVDYYEVLGIEELATLEEVKAAYKKLSLVYHPDKTKALPPDQQQDYATIFIAVKNAYLVLTDQPTRRQYDRDRDHDRAKAEVNGYQISKQSTVDLTEVLQRIKEMQRPPGKITDVTLTCKLEKFVYGYTKVVTRPRKEKDFYSGVTTQDHTFRIDLPKGATEPFASFFKEQGDWQPDTKPESLNFEIRAKPHATVERRGNDLALKSDIDLGAGAQRLPYISAQSPSIRGRHILLWGRNPFFPAAGAADAELRVRIQGEGLLPNSFLHLVCRLEGGRSKAGGLTFTRQTARKYLQELTDAHRAWKQRTGPQLAELWRALHEVRPAEGKDPPAVGDLHEAVSAALAEVPGEWGLIARVSAMLSEGDGRYPGLGGFLARNGMAPPGGIDAQGSEMGESGADGAPPRRTAPAAAFGVGGACSAAAMHRRLAHQQALPAECEVELTQMGEPIPLYTTPTCYLTFYSNARQLSEDSRGSLPPMFAVCLSSAICATKKAEGEWTKLRDALVPLLELTAFRLPRPARAISPLQLADFPAPRRPAAAPGAPREGEQASGSSAAHQKEVGNRAFGRGDYYTALGLYAKSVEYGAQENDVEVAAAARSNRSACLVKVGDFEEAVAEAKRALELRPGWGRAWYRAGVAQLSLGTERQQEALDALFKAVELEPSGAHVAALADLARKVRDHDMEAAVAEKEKGNAALAAKERGLAIAHYTLAIEALPPEDRSDPVAQSVLATSRSVAHSNRGGVFCALRLWDLAVADGRKAVAAKPDRRKAHNCLGTALLGAGFVEEAYSEFTWALQIDYSSDLALKGHESSMMMMPMWRSVPARRRSKDRFSLDMGRPIKFTKVHTISDVFFDHRPNEEWIHSIDNKEFQEDVLIVPGNIADTLWTLHRALKTLKSKFRRVFYVPGSRDVWMNPGEIRLSRFPDSLAKFLAILDVCEELEVDTFPAAVAQGLYIVPLFSWYNAEFDRRSRPDPNNGLDQQCVWPLDNQKELWKYMLKLNEERVGRQYRGTVLTFSHFLPLSALPYNNEGKAGQAMGCEDIEDQIRMVKSTMHIYGHSTVRTTEEYGKVLFVNHYHGYMGTEGAYEGPNRPLCVFSGDEGVSVKKRDRDRGDD
mmetsp:Transcript_98552/g.279280  ORF Transcript_98552/g.279280 Transcript_98552/m.279280 type:complete len:1199 (+) Transcript_98552:93-3689(+)